MSETVEVSKEELEGLREDRKRLTEAYRALKWAFGEERTIQSADEVEDLLGLVKRVGAKLKGVTGGELQFITNEAMLSELSSRHDAVLLVLDRTLSDKQQDTIIRWNGGIPHAIGLADFAVQRILESRYETSQDVDEGDIEEF